MKPAQHPAIHLLIGLLLGFLSAICSTLGWGELDAFVRPPFTFWVFFFLYWLFAWESDPKATFKSIAHWFISFETAPHRLLILGLLWGISFGLSIDFGGFGATGIMVAGTLMTFGSAIWMLKLRFPWIPLFLAFILLTTSGVLIDRTSDDYISLYTRMTLDPRGDMASSPVPEVFKWIALIWQPIAFGALAMQMQIEKRRRGEKTLSFFSPKT